MGAELARKREGKETKTGMTEEQLSDYAATKHQDLPERKGKKKSWARRASELKNG